jgi:hypothetical protein
MIVCETARLRLRHLSGAMAPSPQLAHAEYVKKVPAAFVLMSSANAVGTMPTRMRTINPIPFWPSFEPCAKLTPVQVKTSSPRIQGGGGALPSGRSMLTCPPDASG